MNKSNKRKIFIITIILIILCVLFFYYINIINELLEYKNKTSDTVLDIIIYTLINTLQMMVPVLPISTVQIAASMNYSWYLAIGVCLIGMFVSSTIIYCFVKKFKFDAKMFPTYNKRIEQFKSRDKKKRNIYQLMRLFYVVPIVPTGFICYYGAKSKTTYPKYILSSLVGILPSILFSVSIGNVIKGYILNDINLGVSILYILLILILFMIFRLIVINLLYTKHNKNTPDYFVYKILFFVFSRIVKGKVKETYDRTGLENIKQPCVILSNHQSPFDVYFVNTLFNKQRLSMILNKYYFRKKLYCKLLNSCGIIPKKLFSPDIDTIKQSFRSIKNGYSLFMCPEGRLGLDGVDYPITKETSKFVKKLGVPVVLVKINGAYLFSPKWRKEKVKSKVHTEIKRVISVEELTNFSSEQLLTIMSENLGYNDYTYALDNNIKYNNINKAEGLENVLYYCPKCNKEYSITTNKNIIHCENCGYEVKINEHYSFENNELGIKNIHEWYSLIEQYETKNIEKQIDLVCEVNVKKFNFVDGKNNEVGEGVCYLTNQTFKFEGNLGVKYFEIPIKNLTALAFSCGEEFECYFDNELYYFYPKENRKQCTKWALIVDILNKEGTENE